MTEKTLSWREAAKKELENSVSTLEKEFTAEEAKIVEEARTDKTLIPPAAWCYWGTVVLYVIIQAIVGFVALWSLSDKIVPVWIQINVGWTILLLQAIHFGGSLWSIRINDLAGFSFWGRPWYTPKHGLYIVPKGVLQVIKTDRNYKDKRFPGPPDKIYRVSRTLQDTLEGGDMPPEGKVRPIFVMTGEARLSEEEMKKLKENGGGNPLDRQLSVEISYFVRYRPDQNYGGIFRISRNLSSATGNIDERIQDLIQEQSERDIKAVLSRHTPATIIENWELINQVFVLKLRLAAMRLGIDVDKNGGGLDDLNVSHTTSEDQANVTREQFKKLATITKAEAESIKRQKEREGDAKGELAWLTALAEGQKKIADDLIVDGEAVLASQAVRGVLEKTDVILAGGEGGMKDIMAFVKGAQSAFNSAGGVKKGARS